MNRPRPYIHNDNFKNKDYICGEYMNGYESFLSFHCMISTYLALFSFSKTNNSFSLFIPLVVSLSRICLGVHHVCDVLFGIIYGFITYNVYEKIKLLNMY